MRARQTTLILLSGALTLTSLTAYSVSPPKPGAMCSKGGSTQIYKGKKYTCIKSGKKLVWDKGVTVAKAQPIPTTIPTPTPTPTPTPDPTPTPSPTRSNATQTWTPPAPPTSWGDVVERANGIAYWAWKRAAEKVESSKSTLGNIEITISPNGVPDNPLPLVAMNLVSRFTSNYEEPSKVKLVYAGEKDIEWGQRIIDEFCAERACGYDVSGEAKKACNVPITPCWGGLALRNQRTNIPMIYVTASDWGKTDPNHTQGTLEAHEYFHTIQAVLLKNGGWTKVPRWLIEGGATFVEKATVFYKDFSRYELERVKQNNNTLYRQKPNSEWIENFIDSNYTTGWDKWNGSEYDPWAIYDVGSLVSEVLVAIKGPDSFLDLLKLSGDGKSFTQAFETIYGITWKDASRMIAKAIVAQQK